jgi:hypothetical protein
MSGGIIESALIGAAIGGGTSALTGGDPLKGAVTGAVTGGVGGAIGGPAGGAGGAQAAGSTSPLSTGSLVNGVGTNALVGGDVTKGLMFNGSMLAGSPNFSSMLPGATAATGSAGIASLPAAASAVPSASSAMFPVANAANSSLDSMIANAAKTAPAAAAPQATSILSQLPSAQVPMTTEQAAFTPQAAAALRNAPVVPPEPQSLMGDIKSTFNDVKDWWKELTPKERLLYGVGGSMAFQSLMNRPQQPKEEKYKGPLSKFHYDPSTFVPNIPMAEGGIATLGGANISVGGDPRRNPSPITEDNINQGNWQAKSSPAMRMADGGIASLGSYSDGGRLLKGPGDGMSDNIPAMIGRKQPARLAEGEFVVPADVVSHLGNGSTDAGAKQLYSMMNKVRKARTGKVHQGRQINPNKYLPA